LAFKHFDLLLEEKKEGILRGIAKKRKKDPQLAVTCSLEGERGEETTTGPSIALRRGKRETEYF